MARNQASMVRRQRERARQLKRREKHMKRMERLQQKKEEASPEPVADPRKDPTIDWDSAVREQTLPPDEDPLAESDEPAAQ